MSTMLTTLFLVFFQGLPFVLLLGFPLFLASRWCLKRKNHSLRTAFRVLAWAALAVCVLMCVYGLLRVTGAVILPEDHTHTATFYDAAWQEEGIAVLIIYGSLLGALAAALLQTGRTSAGEYILRTPEGERSKNA